MFKYFESSKFWVPKYYASEMREGEKCVYSAWFLTVPSGFSCRNRKQLTGRGKGRWWQRWEDAVGCSTVSRVCAGVFNIDCCPLSWTEPKTAESTLCWSASCCVFPAHHMQAGPCEGVCATATHLSIDTAPNSTQRTETGENGWGQREWRYVDLYTDFI